MDSAVGRLVGAALALGTLGPLVAMALGGRDPKSAGRLASSSGLALALGYGVSEAQWLGSQAALLWLCGLVLAGCVYLATERMVPEGKAWWAVCVMFAVGVGVFSGAGGGAGLLRQFLAATMGLGAAALDTAVMVVRKSVHVVAYATLGFSAGRLVLEGGRGRVWPGLVWVLALASFDELRQAGTPGRTGLASDVLIDLAGAAVVVVAMEVAMRRASFTHPRR